MLGDGARICRFQSTHSRGGLPLAPGLPASHRDPSADAAAYDRIFSCVSPRK